MFRPVVSIISFYHSAHLRLFYTIRVAACLMRRSQHQNPCWSGCSHKGFDVEINNGRLDDTWRFVSNFAWLLGYHYFRETNLLPLLFTYRYRSNLFITKSLFFECFENMARS